MRDEWFLSDKWTCLPVKTQHMSTWSSLRLLTYWIPWALLNYSLLRFRCCTCIGFDSVTIGSLYFKWCFRLKRRNMLAQVLTAWQTALESPCQSGFLNAPCFGKGEYLLRHTKLNPLISILCEVSTLQCLVRHTDNWVPLDRKHNGLWATSQLHLLQVI